MCTICFKKRKGRQKGKQQFTNSFICAEITIKENKEENNSKYS